MISYRPAMPCRRRAAEKMGGQIIESVPMMPSNRHGDNAVDHAISATISMSLKLVMKAKEASIRPPSRQFSSIKWPVNTLAVAGAQATPCNENKAASTRAISSGVKPAPR